MRQTVNFDSQPRLAPATGPGRFRDFLVMIFHLSRSSAGAVIFASVPDVALWLYGNSSDAQR